MIGTIIGNLDVIKLGIDVETKFESLYGYFDGSNDGKSEDCFLEDFPECNHGKVLGSDEGIKMGSTNGKFIGTILGNVDGITFGLDAGTKLRSLDGSFDGSNDDKLEGLFLEGSFRYTDGKDGSF